MIKRLLEAIGLRRRRRISVIVPVLNEEKTIGAVVRLARRSPAVDEVIVVDDNSADDTAREAEKAGARVVQSARLGKGLSMREGLDLARNEVLVFIDGDIDNYEPDIVTRLAGPVLQDKADFVKGAFRREAGRVTELVAKPLLSILFPELTRFQQPLGGMIAARKEFLRRVTFENDYGVDIGILIDVHNQGGRIREVDIGRIDNKSKPWQALGKMSREVSKAILKRAEIRKLLSLDELETINVIRDEMEGSIEDSIQKLRKMILFDMDGTILQDRFIYRAVAALGLQPRFDEVLAAGGEPYIVTKQIAALLRDAPLEELLRVADAIPVVPDLAQVIATLKSRGYLVGIVSDSYDVVAGRVRARVGADFVVANELEIRGGRATGEVLIPSCFMRGPSSPCSHPVCKANALLHLAEKHGIPPADMIAVGDSENDICMVKLAGIGVAFCTDNRLLNAFADKTIRTRSFKELLDFAE